MASHAASHVGPLPLFTRPNCSSCSTTATPSELSCVSVSNAHTDSSALSNAGAAWRQQGRQTVGVHVGQCADELGPYQGL
eukprot:364500-Chlamydomonas_euryale.AAC.42